MCLSNCLHKSYYILNRFPNQFLSFIYFFFFNATATTDIYTLSYTTLFRSEAPASLGCEDGIDDAPRNKGMRFIISRNSASRTDARTPSWSDSLIGSGPTAAGTATRIRARSEEHTSELQSLRHLVCRLLLEK